MRTDPPRKRGRGRPPRRDTAARASVTIDLTPTERAQLKDRATARGLTAAEAVRTALRCDGLID